MDQIVVFTLDDLLCGLPLESVTMVIHALEIKHLPKCPDIIAGIINVKGHIIPVADVRKRFGFAPRDPDAGDQFIIANTGKRELALWVDTVSGIREITSRQYADSRLTMPFAEYTRGVVKTEEELILIYDLEQFLDLEEEQVLEEALSKKLN